MSKTVDERVVEMRLENKNFENNAKTSLSTLDKLKRSLKLEGAAKGFENINDAAKKVNVSALGNAVETVRARFSSLEVVAVTALANITNSIINTGKQMLYSLTVAPISQGFQEYELKMGSIQTIMMSTGASLEEVNSYLRDLNAYSDKTIYSFADMTSNIGKFTNAGVKLEDAVMAIKGVSNVAAISGANTNEASRAMYNFAQALSAGYVKLMDWKSIENANMATVEFKTQLLESAVACGTLTKTADGMYKTVKGNVIDATHGFNDSLQDQWMTTDALVSTLRDYADETTEIGKKAFAAAQDVKTFSQLMDTLKEAVGSGWASTWETVFGDFEEAKSLWTSLSVAIGGYIDAQSDARNETLKAWKDLGGRTALLETVKNAFNGLLSVVRPIKEAFVDLFPAVTGEKLFSLTKSLNDFSKGLTISGETAEKVKRIATGFFSIFDIGEKGISSVTKALFDLAGSDGIASAGDLFLEAAVSVADFFTSLNEDFDEKGLSGVLSKISQKISDTLHSAANDIKDFRSTFSNVWAGISKVAEKVKSVFIWVKENVSVGDIFAGLAGGGIFVLAKKIADAFDKVKEAIDKVFGLGKDSEKMNSFKQNFENILESVHDSLQSFTNGIKATTLVSIALAIGILAASMGAISELSGKDITKSLFAIGSMMTMLSLEFRSLTKSLSKFDSKGIVKSGIALILVAKAIDILADAMAELSGLSWDEIAKGLVSVGIGLTGLLVAIKAIGKSKISLSTSVATLALAYSCSILGDAMQKFSGLAWDEIGRGLTAMGGALGELVAAVSILGKTGGFKSLLGSLGILVAVQSLEKLADSLKSFATMSWDEIGRGLAAMGGALGELTLTLSVVGKIAGVSSIFAAGALWITIQGLDDLADALKQFSTMSWVEIGRGLTAMGSALGEIGVITGAVGVLAGFSAIIGSGAILITIQGLGDLANSLKMFAAMSWGEIGRGLVAMGGALGEVAVVSGALGALAGLPALLGGGAIFLAVQSLGDLAAALKQFGEMNWDEIGRGLIAMGGALGEIAVGGFLNTLSIIGAHSISEMAAPLGVLADSVKKWENVKIPDGLGYSLSMLAYGVSSFTFGGLGASAIAEVAYPLGTLATSVSKWAGVIIPTGLSDRLKSLADGVSKFTFSGFGASAIAEVAAPLGNLADSVKRWSSVTIPDGLEAGLKQIANGVKSFTWAFVGGWSIDAIIGPLSDLPTAIRKWEGINIPENLSTSLSSLSEGVKSFTWSFVGGWSMDTVAAPLGNLADSIKRWSSVTIPDSLEAGLKQIANGIWAFAGVPDISLVIGNLNLIASTATRFTGIDLVATSSSIRQFTSALSNLATSDFSGISSIKEVPDIIASVAGEMQKSVQLFSSIGSSYAKSFTNSFIQIISAGSSQIKSAAIQLMTSLTSGVNAQKPASDVAFSGIITSALAKIASQYPAFNTSGQSTMTQFITGVKSRNTSALTTMASIISGMLAKIRGQFGTFNTAGLTLMARFISGISSKQSAAASASRNVASASLNAVHSQSGGFYSAGVACANGFANGISARAWYAEARARAMASAALRAANAALGIHSPSKEFYKSGDNSVTGFTNAFVDGISRVVKAAKGIGNSAMDGLKSSISRVSEILNGSVDFNPTITPVLDLSNIQNGVGGLSRLMNSMNGGTISRTVDIAASAASDFSSRSSSHNSISDAIRELRKLAIPSSNGSPITNNHNIFNITGNDPEEIARAVANVLQIDYERSAAAWGY